jgi:nucleotide-binding universal stress UspA family protein
MAPETILVAVDGPDARSTSALVLVASHLTHTSFSSRGRRRATQHCDRRGHGRRRHVSRRRLEQIDARTSAKATLTWEAASRPQPRRRILVAAKRARRCATAGALGCRHDAALRPGRHQPALLGSVSDYVVRNARCLVVVTGPAEWSRVA